MPSSAPSLLFHRSHSLFFVSFNARGVRIELDGSFNPLNVSSDSVGAVTNSLNVSLPGIVTIQ